MKTLKELAKDYINAIENVQLTVNKKRALLRQAKAENNSDAVKKISYELAMLYEEIRDMRLIAQKLDTYYDEDVTLREAV